MIHNQFQQRKMKKRNTRPGSKTHKCKIIEGKKDTICTILLSYDVHEIQLANSHRVIVFCCLVQSNLLLYQSLKLRFMNSKLYEKSTIK